MNIDVIPIANSTVEDGNIADILAVHQDGEVRCLAGDLGTEKWCTSITSLLTTDDLAQDAATTLDIQYSVIIDVDTAGKGILKARADLRAMLGTEIPTGLTNNPTTVLLLVTTPKEIDSPNAKATTVHMFAIKSDQASSDNGFIRSTTSLLQHMHSATLREPLDPAPAIQRSSRFHLHASSGTLYEASENDLRIHDLSGTVPKLLSSIHLGQTHVSSFLRLSSSSLLAASHSSLTVYDTKYLSAQATLPISNVDAVEKKHKTTGAERSPVRLLSYFANLGMVVGLSDTSELLVFQINLAYSVIGGPRKRRRDGLLIDSIGKGISDSRSRSTTTGGLPRTLGEPLSSRTLEDLYWREAMVKLDSYVLQNRMDEFEERMAEELGINEKGRWTADPSQGPLKFSTSRRAKSANTGQARQSSSGNHLNPTPADRKKILYVLGKVFSFTDINGTPDRPITSGIGATSSLKVVFFPPRIFQWLVQSGNIAASHVELALRHTQQSTTTLSLSSGAMTEALILYDPTLEALTSLLEAPVFLDAIELAHVVKRMLHILESREQTSGKLLTNGEGEYLQGEMDDERQCGVTTAVDDVNPPPRDRSSVYRRALVAALKRLYSCPASTITKAFRKELAGVDTVLLIHQLRVELVEGGWTSPYVDGDSSSHLHNLERREALDMIITLLNCAIDSIGMGGWVFGGFALDDPEEREDMIAYMIAEVSAVLEGVEEATYLTGILTEMLLYGKSVGAGRTRANLASSRSNDTAAVSSKPITVSVASVDSRLLPLSLKAPQAIPLTKVGAGGEIQKRSRRDIGRLKSRMVGKYSRERIAI